MYDFSGQTEGYLCYPALGTKYTISRIVRNYFNKLFKALPVKSLTKSHWRVIF